jgi:hypothetical protein
MINKSPRFFLKIPTNPVISSWDIDAEHNNFVSLTDSDIGNDD